MNYIHIIRRWNIPGKGLYLLLALSLSGCAGTTPQEADMAEFQRERAQQTRTQELNEQLALQSPASDAEDRPPSDSYRLGQGDLLDVVVLGVPELNRKVRIDGNGAIGMPLIGEVTVAGLTVDEASRLVAERYEESYLNNPQVSVLIEEYRSQRVTVLGAVRNPEVYAVQRRMSLLGTLAMAGGVTEKAGRTVYVTDWVTDPETQEKVRRNVVVSLDELVKNRGENGDLMLGNEAVVNVPPAGVVYVEGAVMKPGAYPLHGDTTVLKAIAMAGGLQFEAKKGGLQLLRVQDGGDFEPKDFHIDTLRQNPSNDIELQDGDIVVVETHAFKAAMSRLLDTTRGFFGFGYGLNR